MKQTVATAAATALAVVSSLMGSIPTPQYVPVLAAVALPGYVSATTSPPNEPETAQEQPHEEIASVLDTSTVLQKIASYAAKHGVNEGILRFTVSCETAGTFDPGIRSTARYTFSDARRGIVAGEQEQSYGLAQIHLPDNPTVTKEEAVDPDFALEFMASALSRGEFWRWSCLVK